MKRLTIPELHKKYLYEKRLITPKKRERLIQSAAIGLTRGAHRSSLPA
jgi:hypothetical protein